MLFFSDDLIVQKYTRAYGPHCKKTKGVYPKIKAVLEVFKKKNIQQLNLVTDLEAAPEG